MPSRTVIRIVETPGVVVHSDPPAPPGAYLKAYDPDAYEGRGEALWTLEPEEALTFDSHQAALEFWRKPSKVRPLRPDGLPNRPLTAFTVEIVLLKGATQ